MSASPISLATVRFFAQAGTLAPLAFGKLYSYAAGTNTPQALYSDAGGLSALPNPVILDANGEAQVWMGANAYKFNLLDAADVQQANWPQDNISSPIALAAAAQSAAQSFATSADTAVKALIRAEIVAQTNTAFLTTGTGSAYLLSPITPILAYAAGQRYNVQFHADSVSGATIAVSGLGAVTLKQYDNNGAKVDAVVIEDQITDIEYDGTDWVVLSPLPSPDTGRGGVRQCIISGPFDAFGEPDFLPATSVSLTLSTQNITASAPFRVTAASGDSDVFGLAIDDFEWVLPASSNVWLYVDVNTDGTITPGYTTTAPFEAFFAASSTTNGTNIFNIHNMTMYSGNGTITEIKNRVFVGTATTGVGTVTATTQYFYKLYQEFGYSGVFAGDGNYTVPHYVGVGSIPNTVIMRAECLTAENGYAVGDCLDLGVFGGGHIMQYVNKTLVGFAYDGTALSIVEQDGSAITAITPANWQARFIVSRGW